MKPQIIAAALIAASGSVQSAPVDYQIPALSQVGSFVSNVAENAAAALSLPFRHSSELTGPTEHEENSADSADSEEFFLDTSDSESAHLLAKLHVPPTAPEDRQVIDSELLQSLISPEALLHRSKILYHKAHTSIKKYGHPTRVIGSKGHKATLGYIYGTLKSYSDYYNVTTQPFEAVTGDVISFSLSINGKQPKSAEALSLTPPTPHKEPLTAPLVLVDGTGCSPADYPAAVAGAVAFIKRGECPFEDKSVLAGRAGAVAAIVYNNEPGALHGTLGAPQNDEVPTLGISAEDAEPWKAVLSDNGNVTATVQIDSYVQNVTTYNVIAQTLDGDAENVVMLGAHSDSVAAGPGINDDGSGTNSLLEIAAQLTRFNVSNAVRFAWWAGEEEGLLGSDYYVSQLTEDENRRIRLFMDYDMMGSPNFAYQVYNASNKANPVGSEELKQLYIDWYESHGLNYTLIPFDGRSDYDGFIRNGIPGGGIATGAEGVKTEEEAEMFGGVAGEWYDPCYHQLCDDVGNVNMTAFEVNTKLIAHSVATYAGSLDGFPLRSASEASAEESEAQQSQYQVRYHGHKAVM